MKFLLTFFFSEMNNVDINFNKLIDLVEQKDVTEKAQFSKNNNLLTEQKVVDLEDEKNELDKENNQQNSEKDLKDLVGLYEPFFNEAEKKYLWKMFLTYSSDGVTNL
jgi:hypothetical protein